MTVLLITHSLDNESIALVKQGIEARGGKVFRFDTDLFPTEIELDIYYGKETEQVILNRSGEKLDLSEVEAVWYRRIRIGQRIPTEMDSQLRQASLGEARATLLGSIASIKGFHLDPRENIERAKHKQLQLQVARQLGLAIPLTLTTNNPESVVAFNRECQGKTIAKMLSSFAIYDEMGRDKVVFTNPVKPEDLEELEGLRLCPMTFQENIPKQLELRVTIVGKQVFAAAIDSQQLPKARHDWRVEGIALLDRWFAYQLPVEIEQKLLALTDYFGLNYGAIDLILTPDGQYVFLEINPVGEFFWLEKSPGFPISDAIAALLLGK